MKSYTDFKDLLVRGKTKVISGIGVFMASGIAQAINWTEAEANVVGAMDLFIAFAEKIPEIIMVMFIVIIMLGIAFAIRKFADRMGDILVFK